MNDRIHFADSRPEEQRAARAIATMLDFVVDTSEDVDRGRRWTEDSAYAGDQGICPYLPTGQAVHHLLMSAHGSLQAMARALEYTRDAGPVPDMHLDLYGVHDLVRNALESGGWALWLASPFSARRRVTRTLVLTGIEQENRAKARRARGADEDEVQSLRQAQRNRMDAYVRSSGLDSWPPKTGGPDDLLKDGKPTSTKVMRAAELYMPAGLPLGYWGAWCLASGLAHGQQWAFHEINEIHDVDEGRMEAIVTPSYEALRKLLVAACSLFDTALARHRQLATEANPDPTSQRPIPSTWLA